ncbi:hypothetical protein QR680_001157 [Steinernema hermaphroditum]|uniref:Transcription factor CBF/NF-Y/archaeal histone domain-containing protein n=1 Tax=Steinernema hermaphroditum TaxID=289476 RepID=A0AA39LFB6_9BILA|nr:hypothetical protein QR680_001157 [Steinernema hermaphroditum]
MPNTESNFEINLPVGRVKKISRLIPNARMMSAESIDILAFAAEQFVKLLVQESVEQAGRRKTVMAKDIDASIMSDHRFKILDGALDGWPDFESTSHAQRNTLRNAFQRTEKNSEDPHEEANDEDEGVEVLLDEDEENKAPGEEPEDEAVMGSVHEHISNSENSDDNMDED